MLGCVVARKTDTVPEAYARLHDSISTRKKSELPNTDPWTKEEDLGLKKIHAELSVAPSQDLWSRVAADLLKTLHVARTRLQCKRRIEQLRKDEFVEANGHVSWEVHEDSALMQSFSKHVCTLGGTDALTGEEDIAAAASSFVVSGALSEQSYMTTQDCRSRLTLLLDQTFLKPMNESPFSQDEDELLLASVGHFLAAGDDIGGHWDDGLSREDWLRIARDVFCCTRLPSQCKFRYRDIRAARLELTQREPWAWTTDQIIKLECEFRNSTDKVDWPNIRKSIVESGDGPSTHDCILQICKSLKESLDVSAAPSARVAPSWTAEEDNLLLSMYDSFAKRIVENTDGTSGTPIHRTYDPHSSYYVRPNWYSVANAIKQRKIDANAEILLQGSEITAVDCARRHAYLHSCRRAAHEAAIGPQKHEAVILGGNDMINLPKKQHVYGSDFVDSTQIPLSALSQTIKKKRSRVDVTTSMAKRKKPDSSVTVPDSFQRISVNTVETKEGPLLSRQQCFVVPISNATPGDELRSKCLSLEEAVGFRYLCFQTESNGDKQYYKGYIHWGGYQKLENAKLWLQALFGGGLQFCGTGGSFRQNREFCNPEDGDDFVEYTGRGKPDAPNDELNSDGETVGNFTAESKDRNSVDSEQNATKRNTAKRGKWDEAEDVLLIFTVKSQMSEKRPEVWSWSSVANVFKGTRTRHACEKRFSELKPKTYAKLSGSKSHIDQLGP